MPVVISELWVYPIKGAQGVQISEAEVRKFTTKIESNKSREIDESE
jgi:uncharacterized protein YcbX